jgi:hypothetical protein
MNGKFHGNGRSQDMWNSVFSVNATVTGSTPIQTQMPIIQTQIPIRFSEEKYSEAPYAFEVLNFSPGSISPCRK